jgi:hypothetical protein
MVTDQGVKGELTPQFSGKNPKKQKKKEKENPIHSKNI